MTQRSPAETAHLLTLDLYDQVLTLRQEKAALVAEVTRLRAAAEPRREVAGSD